MVYCPQSLRIWKLAICSLCSLEIIWRVTSLIGKKTLSFRNLRTWLSQILTNFSCEMPLGLRTNPRLKIICSITKEDERADPDEHSLLTYYFFGHTFRDSRKQDELFLYWVIESSIWIETYICLQWLIDCQGKPWLQMISAFQLQFSMPWLFKTFEVLWRRGGHFWDDISLQPMQNQYCRTQDWASERQSKSEGIQSRSNSEGGTVEAKCLTQMLQ